MARHLALVPATGQRPARNGGAYSVEVTAGALGLSTQRDIVINGERVATVTYDRARHTYQGTATFGLIVGPSDADFEVVRAQVIEAWNEYLI